MAKASSTYSTVSKELDWLEDQANKIKSYVEANPYDEVDDRKTVISKQYIAGNEGDIVDESYKIVATIEAQHKSLRDSMKEYAQILEVIDKLREKEDIKATARGGAKLSPTAKKLLQE